VTIFFRDPYKLFMPCLLLPYSFENNLFIDRKETAIMTWLEVKKAAEQAGIEDDDDICSIYCAIHHGNKTFRAIRLGRLVRLAEGYLESSRAEAGG
jgi:hypothetical protein